MQGHNNIYYRYIIIMFCVADRLNVGEADQGMWGWDRQAACEQADRSRLRVGGADRLLPSSGNSAFQQLSW